MEFRQLGHSGLQIPILSFGAGTLAERNSANSKTEIRFQLKAEPAR